MSQQPDISVIVVTHNTFALTRACLCSIQHEVEHSQQKVEIILVDNASTDGTTDKVQARWPQVKIITNPVNAGFAYGNNCGLALARGRFYFLLNSDTEVLPGAFAALIDFMDAHPQVGACGPQLLNPDRSLQPSGRPLPNVGRVIIESLQLYRLWKKDVYREVGRNYNSFRRVGEISGAALLVRAKVVREIGGLDESFFAYYEDVDWCKRIGDAGHEIYYVPTAQVIHHWRGTSQAIIESAYRAGQHALRYYFAKHHGRLGQGVIQGLLVLKELAKFCLAMARRDKKAWQFHGRMLRLALSPLMPKPDL